MSTAVPRPATSPHLPPTPPARRAALRIVGVYAVLATLWIFGSDHLETFFLSSVPTFAVIAGETLSRQSLSTGMGPIPLELDEATGAAAIYVFALPQNNENN